MNKQILWVLFCHGSVENWCRTGKQTVEYRIHGQSGNKQAWGKFNNLKGCVLLHEVSDDQAHMKETKL